MGMPKLRNGVIAALAAAALLAAGVGCNWGKSAPTPEAPAPVAQPAPEPVAQPEPTPPVEPAPATEPVPPAEPADVAEAEAPETPPEAPGRVPSEMTPGQLAGIREGMSMDEVRAVMGVAGQPVSQSDVQSAILRWTGKDGTSVIAKFEDGLLTRKSIVRAEQPKGDAPEAAVTMSKELYDEVEPGMTVEDIDGALGLAGKRVAEGQSDIAIYKWVDEHGSNFTAKFENGVLVHKTGFYVAAVEHKVGEAEAASEESVAETAAEEAEAAEEEPDTAAEASKDAEEDTEATAGQSAFPAEYEGEYAEVETPAAPQKPQVTSVRPSRVRVAGATRRAREAEERDPAMPTGSYRPRAKLPDYRWTLRRGAYEVRVQNPTESRVKVGLRSGSGGKDVTISPGGSASFRVDQNTYDIFYVFSDNPYVLHRGGGINLSEFGVADVEVTLIDESYDIRTLDLGFEEIAE